MSIKPVHVLCAFVGLAALAFAAMEISHVGVVFEEKSLFSYMLKAGDTDPRSEAATAHVHGAAAYGRLVALRVGLASAVFGVLAGVFLAQWWRRHASRHPA